VERGRIEPFLLDTKGAVGVEEREEEGKVVVIDGRADGVRVKIRDTKGWGRVRVYDYCGRQIWEWETEAKGVVEVEWDGRNSTGGKVSRGIYFWVIESSDAQMVVPVVWQ